MVNLALIFEQWQTNLSAQGHIDPWSSEIGLIGGLALWSRLPVLGCKERAKESVEAEEAEYSFEKILIALAAHV